MNKTLTPLQIDRLRREAKRLARSYQIPINEAQKQIAQREGYKGWDMLVRTVSSISAVSKNATNIKLKPNKRGCIGPALTAHITDSCVQFILQINEDDVFKACWNGSIWISLRDVENGNVDVESFDVLGSQQDGLWRDIGYSMGMTPLLDFAGLSDDFVLEDDIDDDGESVEPDDAKALYDADVGRAKLIEIARYSIDGCIANVECALLEFWAFSSDVNQVSEVQWNGKPD